MRIEVTDQEFAQMVKEACTYLDADSTIFRVLDRKVKAMQARKNYVSERIKPNGRTT